MFPSEVNVTGLLPHAHFLGQTLTYAQYRNGKFLRWLAKDDVYSYNNPLTKEFNPPIVIKPGDELRTNCTFLSNRNQWTYFGDGTFEEMCLGYVYYYPKINGKVGFVDKQLLCLSYEK